MEDPVETKLGYLWFVERETEQACLYSHGVSTFVSSHQRIGLDAWIRLTFYQPQIPFDPLTLASIPNSREIHH